MARLLALGRSLSSPSVPAVSSIIPPPRPTPSSLLPMATTYQTVQVYSGHESVGVAVSPSTDNSSQALAHRA